MLEKVSHYRTYYLHISLFSLFQIFKITTCAFIDLLCELKLDFKGELPTARFCTDKFPSNDAQYLFSFSTSTVGVA